MKDIKSDKELDNLIYPDSPLRNNPYQDFKK